MSHKYPISLLAGVSLLAMPAASVTAQDNNERLVVDEIIVSARRVNESLTDVPGTVSVVTKAVIEKAGIQRAADFINLTSGVTMVDAAEVGDTQVNIRGINGARDAENSFAFILDGILYTNPAAFNREYSNLSQIEIFKGPQGAIYGRNAAAGAILVNTETPTGQTEGRFQAGYAQDNTWLVKGAYSGAFSDTVFFRVGGDWKSSDGFYRNQYQNDAAVVDRFEAWNVNARLVSELGTATTLDTKIRVGEVDAGSIVFNSTFNLPVFAEALASPAANQDVNEFDFVFDANVPSQNDQKSLEVSTKLTHDFDDMTLTGWVLYSDIENNLMSDGTSAAFGFYQFDSACEASTLSNAGYELLAPQFINISPVGVIFDATNGSFFGAYTPTTCDGIQEQLRNQQDLSAELRLASNGDGPFNWMVGTYLLDIDREVGVSLNRDSGSAVTRGLYQADGPNATAALTWDQFDSTVFAVFGQFTYDMNEDTELSVALRYDNETRKVSSLVPVNATQSVIDLDFNPLTADPLNPGLLGGAVADKKETYQELQPKISLTWDASDDVTLFASWGVGFKAGGFNNTGSAETINGFINGLIRGQSFFSPTDYEAALGVTLPSISNDYGKETSSALETGFKARAMGGRLAINGAGYYTTIDDMQFFEFFVGSFGLLRVVSNIDKVDVYGAEMDVTFTVNQNMRLFAAGNVTESEIKQNSSRPDTIGNKSPYTASYTANIGLDADFELSNDLQIFGRLDARFVGPTWFHTVQEGDRPTIFQPLFDLGFGQGSGGLGTANYSNARREAYQIVNLRLGFGGEAWNITGYVQNMFDTKYLEEVIPAPEFGGSFNAPGNRRRIGVEFSTRF